MPREGLPPGEAQLTSDIVAGSPNGLVGIVGENLRRLRTRRGLSLERLAKVSGVSRAMLGQIELGRSAPTINVLWKIAHSLDLPFSALISEAPTQDQAMVMRRSESKILLSQDGRFSSRALFPFDGERKVEFYELRLAGQAVAKSEAHAVGTTETIVVNRGQLEVEIHGRVHRLDVGDSVIFEADADHAYRNPGHDEGLYYLVMTYVESRL
ncbi:helix-turn-helix domain-containing protein [Telmatospirillum siberiense]|uniref:XRE family transcriptional regulator n=1 Tax=Telmatospirillum siberiense TaxID=382514 RepID=A0A2N3PMP4_9PROT|nr:helix-turn-helix domain-containing protein [Telmatospirillum siberiense]PKU21676.1 XRE family transcriptional regulator [Telmatospirillum siberiense]